MSIAVDQYLADLSPDSEGVLYVRQGGGIPGQGTLGRLVPAALSAMRGGAFTAEIHLPGVGILDSEALRRLLARWVGGATAFVVDIDVGRVYHQPTGATFQIGDGDQLSLLSILRSMPASSGLLIEAGAAEALHLERRRDPCVAGTFN